MENTKKRTRKHYRIREGSPLWIALMTLGFLALGCCPNF